MSTLTPVARDGDKHPDGSLPLGYRTPSRFQLQLGRFKVTQAFRTVSTALGDLAVILGIPFAAMWLRPQHPVAVAAFAATAWVATARALRGLECLTHEASHYNISRVQSVNDTIGNVMAAIPTFQFVGQFRAGHVPKHHQQFGSAVDPDLRRYDELDLHSIDRSTRWVFAVSIARRLPRYIGGWFRNTGTSAKTTLAALLWHAVVYVAPLSIVVGVPRAVGLWLLYFAVPFLTVLPVLRLIGEAAEHVYRGSTSVFDATVSNVGWIHRFLIHPHGDGYHLVHHLWPTVPHHQLAAAHASLVVTDPDGFGRSRQRRSLTEEPSHPASRPHDGGLHV